MTEWIIPANPHYYDHDASFAERGFIDWTQHNLFQQGDIVYVYMAMPIMKIVYKCIVQDSFIPGPNAVDDTKFWSDSKYVPSKFGNSLFVRLRLLKKTNDYKLSYEYLIEHNYINGAIRGGLIISDPAFSRLLDVAFGTAFIEPPALKKTEMTPSVKDNNALRIEDDGFADIGARQACLNHFGTKCQICGFDFKTAYGNLGEGFIHVHQIETPSNIDAKHTVSQIQNLIPVCPNCHAMLHTKDDSGKTPSVDFLRSIVRICKNKQK